MGLRPIVWVLYLISIHSLTARESIKQNFLKLDQKFYNFKADKLGVDNESDCQIRVTFWQLLYPLDAPEMAEFLNRLRNIIHMNKC